jgi:hypothetical protein
MTKILGSLTKGDLLALLTILAVGLLSLPTPLGGDQALFTMAADKLSRAGVLYVDFWDVKQPGVFVFYALAGSLFGFNEVGVHLLELIYNLGFSLALILTLRGLFRHRWVASALPVLAFTFYYTTAGSTHQTQPEALVGFPLFLSMWSAHQAMVKQDGRFWYGLLSGVLAGVVGLFKLALLPIALGIYMLAILDALRISRSQLLQVSRSLLLPAGIGVLAIATITCAYFAVHGAFEEFWFTTFQYLGRLVSEYPPPSLTMRLSAGFIWFCREFNPLLCFGLLGALLSIKTEKAAIAKYMVAWCVIGVGAIIAQVYSRWEYHYFLFVSPLAILSAFAIDRLVEIIKAVDGRRMRHSAVIVTSVVAVAMVGVPIKTLSRVKTLSEYGFCRTRTQIDAYAEHLERENLVMKDDAAFLKQTGAIPGNIIVLGSPKFYLLSGRLQAGRQHGWCPDVMLQQQWLQLRTDIEMERPPYIVISTGFAGSVLAERSPETLRLIQQRYQVVRSSQWVIYARETPPDRAGPLEN